MGAVIAKGAAYSPQDIEELAQSTEAIKEELKRQEEINKELVTFQQDAMAQKTLMAEQKAQLDYQKKQLDQLSLECSKLMEVEEQRHIMQRERFNLDKAKQRAKREDEVLDLPFTCMVCKRSLSLKEVKTFCDQDERLKRLKGMHEAEQEMFLQLRPYMKLLFDQADKRSKGFLDGSELCIIKATLELADEPYEDRGRKRQANVLRKFGNREKRVALTEFNASREVLMFEEFWSRFLDVNRRPPMFVLDFLFRENSIVTPIGETFCHIPEEGHLRKMLNIAHPDDVDTGKSKFS